MDSKKQDPNLKDVPLGILDEVEGLKEVLDDSEINLVNSIFKDMEDFYMITEIF